MKLVKTEINMSGNSRRYSYVQFMTFIVLFLGFIGELFKGQSNANNKENKHRNYHLSQKHAIKHGQD